MTQEQEFNFNSGADDNGRLVYTVSQINNEIKEVLERSYPSVWIEGEISNFKFYNSGHAYFYLKDEKSQIKAVMFAYENTALAFEPQDGMKVLLFGRISAYAPRGDYQVIATRMEQTGAGDLAKKFEELKKRLEKEGFFEEARKRKLPRLINKVGIVTSQDGAALHDILKVFDDLGANLEILIYPSRVQGKEAQKEIPAAIKYLNKHYQDLDILLVGRGGGSIEDLWAFNTEPVARAIFESKIPIISCVGHEVDYTIADFTADFRAPTPSAAAEFVVREKLDLIKKTAYMWENLISNMNYAIGACSQRLKSAALSRCFTSPHLIYEDKIAFIDQIGYRLQNNIDRLCSYKAEKLASMAHKLELVSPLSVLKRGYSVCSSQKGLIIKDISAISVGESVSVRLSKGGFQAKVLDVL